MCEYSLFMEVPFQQQFNSDGIIFFKYYAKLIALINLFAHKNKNNIEWLVRVRMCVCECVFVFSFCFGCRSTSISFFQMLHLLFPFSHSAMLSSRKSTFLERFSFFFRFDLFFLCFLLTCHNKIELICIDFA